MYFADSIEGTVTSFDYDVSRGRLGPPTILIKIQVDDGVPDGLAVDSNGGLLVALWDGWSIRKYDKSGKLLSQLDVPVRHITNCAFAGFDLLDLVITTAQPDSHLLGDQPLAGCVFQTSNDVAGVQLLRLQANVPFEAWGSSHDCNR